AFYLMLASQLSAILFLPLPFSGHTSTQRYLDVNLSESSTPPPFTAIICHPTRHIHSLHTLVSWWPIRGGNALLLFVDVPRAKKRRYVH
ncbi:hypothetical protein P692DRAFT_20686672, partial [Suillus brevipes Sb2]